jgi:hypothetical protein
LTTESFAWFAAYDRVPLESRVRAIHRTKEGFIFMISTEPNFTSSQWKERWFWIITGSFSSAALMVVRAEIHSVAFRAILAGCAAAILGVAAIGFKNATKSKKN